jgi:hypothetical protein
VARRRPTKSGDRNDQSESARDVLAASGRTVMNLSAGCIDTVAAVVGTADALDRYFQDGSASPGLNVQEGYLPASA